MAITPDSIRQIVAATDILQLIGSYVTLKKAGHDVHKGLCPFHPEKTPSFNVNDSRQTYHCFGCQKHGDALTFVREHLSLPFLDAVKFLAQRAGIVIVEEARDPQAESKNREKGRLISLHNDLAKWMNQQLLQATGGERVEVARNYLKSRGLTREVCQRWMIGYAPEMLNLWREFARSKGYKDEDLIAGGIAIQKTEGDPRSGIYVRFRHRIMFPVHNEHGDVIAFSGRLLDADQKGGKYINSPETPIFKKSQVLFGWDKARRPISKADKAIVCEGQIDLITAVEHGVDNIIAPLGTALTELHGRMIRRAANQVILCYDADNAGYSAAGKSFRILAPEGVMVKVATLPKGDDPDTVIRRDGVEAFKQQLAAAKDYFDFLIDRTPEALDGNNVVERTKLVATLADNLLLIQDKVAQDSYLGRCATRLNIPTTDIRLLMSREVKKQKFQEKTRREAAERQAELTGKPVAEPKEPTGTSLNTKDDTSSYQISNPSLRQLLYLSMTNAEVFEYLNDQAAGGDIPWQGLLGGELLEKILIGNFDPQDPGSRSLFLNKLDSAQRSTLGQLLADESPQDGLSGANQAILTLRRDALNRRKALLAEQLRRPDVTTETFLQVSQELARIKVLEKSIATERLSGISIVPMETKKAGPPKADPGLPNEN